LFIVSSRQPGKRAAIDAVQGADCAGSTKSGAFRVRFVGSFGLMTRLDAAQGGRRMAGRDFAE
jgi:hypothetical protein